MKKSELKEIIKECYEELNERLSPRGMATMAINSVGQLINLVDSDAQLSTLNDIQNKLRKIEKDLPR